MNTFCKLCKKQANFKETRIWIRMKVPNFGGKPDTTYTQCYHNECFDSIAGAEFTRSVKQCALCEERVSMANGTSTICEGCAKDK